jgi:hypothetical protein
MAECALGRLSDPSEQALDNLLPGAKIAGTIAQKDRSVHLRVADAFSATHFEVPARIPLKVLSLCFAVRVDREGQGLNAWLIPSAPASTRKRAVEGQLEVDNRV